MIIVVYTTKQLQIRETEFSSILIYTFLLLSPEGFRSHLIYSPSFLPLHLSVNLILLFLQYGLSNLLSLTLLLMLFPVLVLI
jgi:hypothetical protein